MILKRTILRFSILSFCRVIYGRSKFKISDLWKEMKNCHYLNHSKKRSNKLDLQTNADYTGQCDKQRIENL